MAASGRRALVSCAAGLLLVAPVAAFAAGTDPAACLQEIEKVCTGLESSLETCLAERGNQLTADCRDEFKAAMALAQDPSGPAACIPDVERLCPDRTPQAIAACISGQQSHFSQACQKYLQAARQSPAE